MAPAVPNRPRTFLIVATVILVVGGLASVFPAVFTAFMFDAPGSSSHPITVVLALSIATVPVSCLVAIVAAWILYALGRRKAACWIVGLPIINVVVCAGAFVCLQVFQGGRF